MKTETWDHFLETAMQGWLLRSSGYTSPIVVLGPAAVATPRSLSRVPHPELLNQNLNWNQIPAFPVCTAQSEDLLKCTVGTQTMHAVYFHREPACFFPPVGGNSPPTCNPSFLPRGRSTCQPQLTGKQSTNPEVNVQTTNCLQYKSYAQIGRKSHCSLKHIHTP